MNLSFIYQYCIMNTNFGLDYLLGENLGQETLHVGKVGIHSLRPMVK